MNTAPKNPSKDADAAPAKSATPAKGGAAAPAKGTAVPPAAAPAAPAEKPEKKGEKREKPAKAKEPKAKAGKGPGPGTKKVSDNPDFRYIVRLASADLDGTRAAALALTGVRGVGLRMADVVCRRAGVDGRALLGDLPEATVEGLEKLLSDLPHQLPPWMLNRPRDWVAGETHHFVGAELETARRDDVNILKMVRSYRGVRHERGQKVRGQRTRSNGRTGMAAGVLKKAAKEAGAKAGAAKA